MIITLRTQNILKISRYNLNDGDKFILPMVSDFGLMKEFLRQYENEPFQIPVKKSKQMLYRVLSREPMLLGVIYM